MIFPFILEDIKARQRNSEEANTTRWPLKAVSCVVIQCIGKLDNLVYIYIEVYTLCVPIIPQQRAAGPALGWSTDIWICCGIGGTNSTWPLWKWQGVRGHCNVVLLSSWQGNHGYYTRVVPKNHKWRSHEWFWHHKCVISMVPEPARQ
jgi:hypothetical protein